ncbi:MAG TPA: hypothetical protein VEZ70_06475 [Allosphingosinicella sp.]|nr:hypothetical protein [Allosphingosinicella sp.]
MKTVFFAAAFAFSAAAVAQPTGNTVNDPSQATGPRGVTQQGTSPSGQACVPAGYNQGASSYPTCDGAMGGSAGTGMAGGAMVGGAMAGGTTGGTMTAGTLPPCSRTVTDRCTQTYERGVRRR